MKVINKITGEIFNAGYYCNSRGNMRMWVNGKFYTDKKFDQTFAQLDITEYYIKLNGKWQPRHQHTK